MLPTIGRQTPERTTPEDAVDLLLACHVRIRHFSALAVRLIGAAAAPADEIAEAAGQAHRYFAHALPLHSQDEDQSLRPRLERHAGGEVLAAADLMTRQHEEIGSLLAELLPLWERIAADPGRLADLSSAAAAPATRLEQLLRAHLGLEEETIFPALRRDVPPADMAEILAEMRARRS